MLQEIDRPVLTETEYVALEVNKPYKSKLCRHNKVTLLHSCHTHAYIWMDGYSINVKRRARGWF